MAFCKYSTELIASSKTEIDNIFINDYIPFAQPQFVVVYIYGLYLCGSTSFDNSLENFAKTLNMSEEDVIGAFEYWEEQGLVKILRTNPIMVTYIPLKNVLSANKLYKPDKYETFNQQAQEIFLGKRSISKHEYEEYYDFLERYHVEQEALLMIMRYCVDVKKSAVGYNYILTVAKNWANEGVTTTMAVEEKLKALEEKDSYMTDLFAALNIKRAPYVEEKAFMHKWMSEMGFEFDCILYLAKKMKKKGYFSFEKADEEISRYYEMKLLSVMEIETFEKEKTKLYDLAREINKTMGIYYQSLDMEVEEYILKWINLGFDQELLLELASDCFLHSIRTLEGLDKKVAKFYKMGIVSLEAFHQHMESVLSADKNIKEMLEKLGLSRNVSQFDRVNFKTWREDWNLSEELITHAASLAKGKENPMSYLSRVLADWHTKGVKTVEEANKLAPTMVAATSKAKSSFSGRSYSKEDVNALFQSIDEIDV